jgi:hypothetical protein
MLLLVGWNVDFGRWQDWRGRLLDRFIRERRVWRGESGALRERRALFGGYWLY